MTGADSAGKRRRGSLAALPPRAVGALRAILFAIALAPLARLVIGGSLGKLGANPVELIQRSTGTWALAFVMVTLSVTPLRRLTGWNWLLRVRRMLGLYAFFYGVLHFTSYVWLDQFFDVMAIAKDVLKRPFITIGFAVFLMMIPLAVTSTDAMVRRLGAKNWIALHRLVYVLAISAVIHYWWLVKRDITQPAIYALILALLLGYRAVAAAGRRTGKRPA